MNRYFEEQMKQLLQDEYEQFVRTRSLPIYKALRINTAKADYELIRDENLGIGKKSPFDENTYYIDSEEKLGKHPYHNGGLYYLQDPSATMAVNALQLKEDDMVLDLCAAPGGKSTQILNRLSDKGFLVTNEINYQRSVTLLSNLERWGYSNYLLTNDKPENIARCFEGCFDKVLVDAPCSGTAMFKKYPETENQYSEQLVLMNQQRQLEILQQAYRCLKKDGVMVYSTCTFNMVEDEEVIYSFLHSHEDMILEDTGLKCGRRGFPYKDLSSEKLSRAFPMDEGEGHFVARMRKTAHQDETRIRTLPYSKDKTVDEFIRQNINEDISYTVIKDKVYYGTCPVMDVRVKTIRQGILMGEIIKNRFEPAHQLFLSKDLTFRNVCNTDDISTAEKFMKGESLMIKGYKGYVQICYKNKAIGFGKGDGNQIKNHYPKGLRLK